MALVTLLAFLPSLLLSAFAGVLADRYDRRLLMVLGDGLSAVGIAFILVCMLTTGEAQLWQICVGVAVSSIFSSLLEPSYKSTVTDLLTKEQYTKASGLVQLAGSAKFLISPALAGFLLSVSGVELLLIIDICTIFVTILSTLAVRKGLKAVKVGQPASMLREFRDGWEAVAKNRGVLLLVILSSVITLSMGIIQVLFAPTILAFSSSSVLGSVESISALGLLVTSLVIGVLSIKQGHVKMLSGSLLLAGIFMVFFGLRENLILICVSGFLFFAMLPFANTGLDYLVRTNISNALQGRAWGLIGIISQIGYIVAYVFSGVLADYVFTPLLLDNGALANSIGRITGTGEGRGAGLVIVLAGILLCGISIVLYRLKSIRMLENRGSSCITESSETI